MIKIYTFFGWKRKYAACFYTWSLCVLVVVAVQSGILFFFMLLLMLLLLLCCVHLRLSKNGLLANVATQRRMKWGRKVRKKQIINIFSVRLYSFWVWEFLLFSHSTVYELCIECFPFNVLYKQCPGTVRNCRNDFDEFRDCMLPGLVYAKFQPQCEVLSCIWHFDSQEAYIFGILIVYFRCVMLMTIRSGRTNSTRIHIRKRMKWRCVSNLIMRTRKNLLWHAFDGTFCFCEENHVRTTQMCLLHGNQKQIR